MPGAARDLPWRRNRSPYAVWISEVMLQQTQVATVIPYFDHWLTRFPDVTALAAAPLDDVLKIWEGLGYYARARNAHRAARLMVDRHGGRVPADRKALLALPGIGRYTVGAVLSLAYGLPEPILDGNVRRVLCRLYDVAEDPRKADVEARLWDYSAAILRAAGPGSAGEINEALMELGALVCGPVKPDCPACPVRQLCQALRRDTVAARPARPARPALPHYSVAAAVVARPDGSLLILRRPPSGLLGGLWGFASGVVRPGESLAAAAERVVFDRTGMTIRVARPLPIVKHAYTHFRITLHAFAARVEAGAAFAGDDDARWVRAESLNDYAFPVTDRKVAAEFLRSGGGDGSPQV